MIDIETPLRSDEMDRKNCCPTGGGHRLGGGYQPCHLMCAEASTDRDAVIGCRYWWRTFLSLRWWEFSERREALRKVRYWREIALDAPHLPPPKPAFRP